MRCSTSGKTRRAAPGTQALLGLCPDLWNMCKIAQHKNVGEPGTNRWRSAYSSANDGVSASAPMSERAEDLRREAARCLAQARTAANAATRNELISMAARFHELALSAQGDFETILRAFNDAQMAHAPH